MKKKTLCRWIIYVIGMLCLALGIVLNTKSGLGTAPIAATPFAVAEFTGLRFGDLSLVLYCIFAVIEFILKGKDFKKFDLLQLPFTFAFTRCMNWYTATLNFDPQFLWQRVLIMAVGIIFTGAGVAMSVEMRLIPNPSDGLVQVISDRTGLKLGLTKNIFDAFCVVMAILVGLLMGGRVVGVGAGTICALFGNGRAVDMFNRFFKKKMLSSAFDVQEEAA